MENEKGMCMLYVGCWSSNYNLNRPLVTLQLTIGSFLEHVLYCRGHCSSRKKAHFCVPKEGSGLQFFALMQQCGQTPLSSEHASMHDHCPLSTTSMLLQRCVRLQESSLESQMKSDTHIPPRCQRQHAYTGSDWNFNFKMKQEVQNTLLLGLNLLIGHLLVGLGLHLGLDLLVGFIVNQLKVTFLWAKCAKRENRMLIQR